MVTAEVEVAQIGTISPLLPDATVKVLQSYQHHPCLDTDKDYFLEVDGSISRLDYHSYKDIPPGEIPSHIGAYPLIWIEWLKGPDTRGNTATLVVGDSTVIAATGLKGSSKSLTLAYLTAKALTMGMPVWSNMGVKFFLVLPDGSIEFHETKELDWNALLSLKKEMQHGAVCIDELSYYASSRVSGSIRNRLLNAVINQVRKRALDFYASVKFLRQIDVNIREELDAEIACEDFAKSGQGQKLGLPKGCYCRWLVRDISGWSGNPTDLSREQNYDSPIYADAGSTREFCGRFCWPIYNSFEVVEVADVFRKIRLDLEDMVVSDKQPHAEIEALIGEAVSTLTEEGHTEVGCDDFRSILTSYGVNMSGRKLGKTLKDMGIIRNRKHRGNFYNLGNS